MSRRILIVDDHEDIRDLVSVTLQTARYETDVAANGREALEAIAHKCPDLIILDVMMPVMDGCETFIRLREDDDTARLPIIVLTALMERPACFMDDGRGLVWYCTKPLDPAHLLRLTQQILELNAALHD